MVDDENRHEPEEVEEVATEVVDDENRHEPEEVEEVPEKVVDEVPEKVVDEVPEKVVEEEEVPAIPPPVPLPEAVTYTSRKSKREREKEEVPPRQSTRQRVENKIFSPTTGPASTPHNRVVPQGREKRMARKVVP